MEEARPVVDQICLAVIKPGMRNTDFDCSKYRAEVETAINEFKARP
jgi:hypothetical protein